MPTFNLISLVTLGSGTSSVTFSSIPQTYKDLIIIGSTRTNLVSTEQYNGFRYNGVNASSTYGYTLARSDDGSASTFRESAIGNTTINFGSPQSASSALANTLGSYEIYIANYATASWNKTATNWGFAPTDSINSVLSITANSSVVTGAVTSLTVLSVYSGTADYVSGSIIALYGI
jgi:hypothetical protein